MLAPWEGTMTKWRRHRALVGERYAAARGRRARRAETGRKKGEVYDLSWRARRIEGAAVATPTIRDGIGADGALRWHVAPLESLVSA
jgi:hypothetical protein